MDRRVRTQNSDTIMEEMNDGLGLGFMFENWSDTDGNPAGGVVIGHGFTISWQNGPLGLPEDRRTPNGAFVEDVLYACMSRLDYYQESKFACAENAEALAFIRQALTALNSRTANRESRGVGGTHQV